ncbi:uncharacterized protein LOC129052255 [Pongo abelii]|uniref:uncharacterized protein LOC129052255 n=1 Tax=Pongo abelii TaxID=9601 RepID=UPI0023E8B7AC|nr:uncharacterized protein LOC129052255 [Pongo abelii]
MCPWRGPGRGVPSRGVSAEGDGGGTAAALDKRPYDPAGERFPAGGPGEPAVHRRPAARRILTKPPEDAWAGLLPSAHSCVLLSQITVCGFCDVYQGDILKLERGSAPGGETAHGSRETPPPRTPSGTGRPSRVVGTVRGPVPRAPLSQGRQQQPDTRRALGTPPRPRPLLILPHSIPLHTGRSHQSSAAGASTPCECSVGLTLRALLSRLWNLCHPSRHRSASPAAAPPAWAHPRAPSVPSFLLAGLSPVALWPNMSSAVVLSTRFGFFSLLIWRVCWEPSQQGAWGLALSRAPTNLMEMEIC